MPSIKKKVSGFIRQFSSSEKSEPKTRETQHKERSNRRQSRHAQRIRSPPPKLEKCFIQRYLCGEQPRAPAPEIQHAKTGYTLTPVNVDTIDPEVFAAYTGPAGGITCLHRSALEAGFLRFLERNLDVDKNY